jgi:type IV secretion system protein VirB1
MQCAPAIAPETVHLLVTHESGRNPYAVAVVGQTLPLQPQSLDDAVAVANRLAKEGASFSVGLGQINSQHFKADDPQEVAKMFDPCRNLQLTETILQDCYARALDVDPNPQGALRKALSCYYSGNFTGGLKAEPEFGQTSYVERVLATADLPPVPAPDSSSLSPVPTTPVAPSPQPTYESWDVLRQYPRAAPTPPATTPEPKAQNINHQEKEDV